MINYNYLPKSTLVLSAVMSANSAAFAFDADTDRIIVSATRTDRTAAEIGSTVTVINAEAIRLRQYSFVADALRDTAGVALARNGSYGGAASIRLRGSTSGQTLIIVDGIVMNDVAAPQGGFNFANLDVVDIERIEVLRGPQSVLYGADAIGGVITITTRKADDVSVSAFFEGGSRATTRGGASLSGTIGRASGRLTVSGVRTDGVSRADGGAENDGFRSLAASFKGDVDLSPDWGVGFVARYGDAAADIDGFPPPTFTLTDSNETEDTEEFAVAVRAAHRTEQLGGILTISYNEIDRINRDGGAETFRAMGNRLSIDYLADFRLSDMVAFTAGAEAERVSVDVSSIEKSADSGAIFAVFEIKPLPSLAVSVGVRHDEFSNFDGATTARTAAAWTIGASTILRASWGEGFRAPTLFELNYDQFGIIPNPNLKPEHAIGYDAGIEHAVGAQRLRATFFHQRTRDQIDFDFAGFGYFNIDRTRSRGVEVEADLHALDWLNAILTYTFTDAIDSNTGARLSRISKHQGTATLIATPHQNLCLSASVNFNGKEPDFPMPNDSFVRLDLRAAYAVSPQLEVYGRVENATDADYQDVSGYGEPGASAFAGIRVKL